MEASLLARLERAVERLEKYTAAGPAPSIAAAAAPAAQGPSSGSGASASALVEWDQLLSTYLQPLARLCSLIPAEAQEAAQEYEKAYRAVRLVLEASSLAKQPAMEGIQQLLSPVAAHMMRVSAAAEQRRNPGAHMYIKTLAEALQALGFLSYTGPACGMNPPRQHVAESWQSAEFFANKVLMEFRGKDEEQVAWAKGIKELTKALEQYVMRNYPTGLKWDPNGLPIEQAVGKAKAGGGGAAAPPAAGAAAPRPAGRGPPPPPPPGPPPKPLSPEELNASASGRGSASGGAGAGLDALFKDLQKGEDITSGLRKVTDDMKAKNRAERSGVVAAAATAAPPAAPKAAGGARGVPTGTPNLEFKELKWVVEYQVGAQELVIDKALPKHKVYVYGCRDCVLQVNCKVNTISLDSCSKVGVVFQDVIASVEAVNCNSIQLQATGTVPTVAIEKTDGAQIYVSSQCASDPNFQVITAKCSALNVVVLPPPGTEDVDAVEHAVPEQYISTFKNGQLVTVAAAHSAA